MGGIPLRELNQLELELLFLIDFHLHITLEELQEYADQLLSHAMSLPKTPLPQQLQPQKSLEHFIPSITQNNHNNHHITNNNNTHQHQHNQKKVVIIPLTPPYNSSSTTEESRKKIALHHPYHRPISTKKKRLGLVSPKED